MIAYTCGGCGGSFTCHVGSPDKLGRKVVCPGCRWGRAPSPPPPVVRVASFADLDPGERRRYRGGRLGLRL